MPSTRANSSIADSYQAWGSRDGSANRLRRPRIAIARGNRIGSDASSSGTSRTNGTNCRFLRNATAGHSSTSPRTASGSRARPAAPSVRRGCCRRARPAGRRSRAGTRPATCRGSARRAPCRRLRAAVAGQVGRQHAVVARQRRDQRQHRGVRGRQAVHEHDRRRVGRAGLEVERLDAVGVDRAGVGARVVLGIAGEQAVQLQGEREVAAHGQIAGEECLDAAAPAGHDVVEHRQGGAHGRRRRGGLPPRADVRPRSMSTVQVARPPAVNRIVAVVSASSGEYRPSSRLRSSGSRSLSGTLSSLHQ